MHISKMLPMSNIQVIGVRKGHPQTNELKFIYSEKAKIFCEISTVDLSYYVETVKSTVEILRNFVNFMNFI